MELKPGQIGFSYNSTSWLSKLIAFFTRSEWSHTFLLTRPVSHLQTVAVQEANTIVRVVPFGKFYADKVEQKWEIWEVKGLNQADMDAALSLCFDRYSGVTYGFLQLPWFIWRWLNEKLGRDIRKTRNPWSKGIICSELVFEFLHVIGKGDLLADLQTNTVHPEDLLRIFKAHPEMFARVGSSQEVSA